MLSTHGRGLGILPICDLRGHLLAALSGTNLVLGPLRQSPMSASLVPEVVVPVLLVGVQVPLMQDLKEISHSSLRNVSFLGCCPSIFSVFKMPRADALGILKTLRHFSTNFEKPFTCVIAVILVHHQGRGRVHRGPRLRPSCRGSRGPSCRGRRGPSCRGRRSPTSFMLSVDGSAGPALSSRPSVALIGPVGYMMGPILLDFFVFTWIATFFKFNPSFSSCSE